MSKETRQQERAKQADPRYTEIPIPCQHCKNLISMGNQFDAEGWTCSAFPDGIPYTALTGRYPHTEPVGYQSGDMVAFEPVIYTEEDTGRKWHYTADRDWQYVEE